MSKFKYQGRSAETVANRAKQSGGNFDSYLRSDVSFLKVKEGDNKLRIMPATWDTKGPWGDNWGIEIYAHRDVGPDGDVYLCIDEMRKKYGEKWVPAKLGDCPLCEHRNEVADDEELSKKLRPGKQILCWVINRLAEKDGPVVWRLGWQQERDIQLRCIDKEDNSIIPIDHPDYGYDLSFSREGTGLKTKYIGNDIARRESPLHDKQRQQDDWLEYIEKNPLPEMLVFYDEEYLRNVYRGRKAKRDEAEDDSPSRSRGRDEARDEGRVRGGRDHDEEDRGRGRGRDRDEDRDEGRGRSRGRGRDEPEEEEDDRGRPRGEDRDEDRDDSRGRGRSRDEEDDTRVRSRSRDDDRDDRGRDRDRDDDRGRGRGRSRDDDDDRLPNDDEMARNTQRLRERNTGDDDDPGKDDEGDDRERGAPERRRSSRVDNERDGGKGSASDRAKESLGRLGKGDDGGRVRSRGR